MSEARRLSWPQGRSWEDGPIKVSERLQALRARAASDHSTISWPAQVALAKLGDAFLFRLVQALEQAGHGDHGAGCASCSLLAEAS